jgi:integrase
MKTNLAAQPEAEAPKIVPLDIPRLGRIPKTGMEATRRQRFRILEFQNTGGSVAYRVQGMKRDATYIRQNYADLAMAKNKQIELEAEYLQRQPDAPAIRATTLTDSQVRFAETVFRIVDADEDVLTAVQFWKQHRDEHAKVEAPRIDDAVDQFKAWLASPDCELRDRTKSNLRVRVSVFANSVRNLTLDKITPDTIAAYLEKRSVCKASKDNDRRVLSRFFSWCLLSPRRWVKTNPARKEVRERKTNGACPEVLTVDECKTILKAAERHRKGRLVPYVAACLFGGLRPFEAMRLTWDKVNLQDGEIRLEADMTKTGRPRVVSIGPTLSAWLARYRGRPFYPSNWRKDFDTIKTKAGFGGRAKSDPENKLKPWPEDVLRHTAISHFFRKTGSYGLTAEQFGNSESIIKLHYQGRVTSQDTKRFYRLTPQRKAAR